jgi:glutathione S-transferase
MAVYYGEQLPQRNISMLKILGKSSSINVRKVLWTCEEIGLPYELEQYGGGFQPTATAEFLRLNPNGMVPVIIDEGQALWESNTICRYLAGKHGRTDLLPAGQWRGHKWKNGWTGRPPN